jgi:hypothetical protein
VEHSLAINDTNYIQCTSSCSQINLAFSQPTAFPTDCQENNNIKNIYDYALACGIKYHINYDTQQISIHFQAINHTGNLEDGTPSESLVQTIWLSLSQKTVQRNEIIRTYNCSTNNDCARKFYLNSIDYLVTEGTSKLQLIRTRLHNDSLLMGEESRRRCIVTGKLGKIPSDKCKNGLCYLDLKKFELNEQPEMKIQTCDPENEPYLFSEIEHHTPKSTQNEREFLEYKCNKNVCNRDSYIESIKNLINGYTNGTSKNQNNKSITEKKGNSSIKQTISSYILVLFLILIQLFI